MMLFAIHYIGWPIKIRQRRGGGMAGCPPPVKYATAYTKIIIM